MRWVIAAAVLAVGGYAVAYALGADPIGPVIVALVWGGIVIGLVLTVFRKPRSIDRAADEASAREPVADDHRTAT